jgi:hypothetical protein
VFCWPTLIGAVFVIGSSAIAFLGDESLDYVVGQRIDQPIYAKVRFQVPDPEQTEVDRKASRAKTPSTYILNDPALTFGRVRADLLRLYQVAADADTYDAYVAAMDDLKWPADRAGYDRLRGLVDMPGDAGRNQVQEWVDRLPLEGQFVVRGLYREPREPASATDFVLLETRDAEGVIGSTSIPHSDLVPQGNEKALQGSAAIVARKVPAYELRSAVEAIIVFVFREQPTIMYSQERTTAAMQKAEEAAPSAWTVYEKNKPYISPGTLEADGYQLLEKLGQGGRAPTV